LLNYLTMKNLRKKYESLLSQSAIDDLTGPLDINFCDDDIFSADGTINHQSNLLLGYYPEKVIDHYFSRFQIAEIFRKLGIPDIHYKIDVSDPYEHKFYIWSGGVFDDIHKVVEIVLKKKVLKVPSKRDPGHKYIEFLYIEWLLMQHPFAPFSDKKPRLPGQRFPGLRIGNHVLEILYNTAKKIHTYGLANSPNYLHTAIIFSKEFKFIDPAKEAIAQAAKGYLLKRYSLWTIAWAAVHGAIYHLKDHKPLLWESSPMVLPISDEMRNYFNSRWYREQYRKHKDEIRVGIDLELLQEKMSADPGPH
jgi:hypothetical protein